MTLCVGLATARGVWIGADSGSTIEEATEVCTHTKLWRSNGWLVASAGNWRALEIIRYDLDFPKKFDEPHRALCMDLQTDIAKAFERNNFELKKNDEGDVTTEEAYYILAARDGHLYFVEYTGHVERQRRYAIGTGADYAMGLIDSSDLGSAEKRIRRAMVQSAKRYRSLIGPYTIDKA